MRKRSLGPKSSRFFNNYQSTSVIQSQKIAVFLRFGKTRELPLNNQKFRTKNIGMLCEPLLKGGHDHETPARKTMFLQPLETAQ